jgi:acyl-CoA reductase-like NAD-dependent aldehyde dehydrogenase
LRGIISIQHLQHIINGTQTSGNSGRVFDIHNPATGQVSKQMESTSANDTAKAIVASEKFGIQTQ